MLQLEQILEKKDSEIQRLNDTLTLKDDEIKKNLARLSFCEKEIFQKSESLSNLQDISVENRCRRRNFHTCMKIHLKSDRNS